MGVSSLLISLGLGVAFVYLIAKFIGLSNGNHPPLPPGPKGLPIVGNLNDLPQPGVLECDHWLKHKELYGPLSSITVMGQTIVIINDAKLAFELLEKRSAKHSSRPRQIFAGEMIGWENSLGLSPYNNQFRTHRKNMGRIIGTKNAASQFNELQESEVGHFLLHLLNNPEDFMNHAKKEAGAVILKIAYGYTAESHKEDLLVDLASDAMDKFGRAAVPGAFLVDVLPFLRRIPEWIPGAGFQKLAQQWGSELVDVLEKPCAFVKHQMSQGKNETSFLSKLLEAGDKDPQAEFTNKWTTLSLYTAGADTTVSSITCFFLAMTIYPEVQQKAQEEIDRVVGQDRLPTMIDRDNLPYIEAMIKEVLRWHPVAPMALPHASIDDDVCEGYFIPKGSMLLPNVWNFTHDSEVYQDPMTFRPERFLEEDGHKPEPDPRMFAYGFGRRICPGRYLADNALYLNIVQTLATFKISKYLKDGQEISPILKFEPGVIRHPVPYKNVIKPRSPHHEALIKSLEGTYPWQESDSKTLANIV
ncbi:putative cytochrome P450 oxidoreductase OrdA-like protein [Annulohypoxylon maeteangense]|uniref:putative cytochrome P450 oxidoreductase OrdA-like protein n=1 Tax=Annulohypoxylon maeteangense TaxID=1927788 RepID=UPI00200743DC|nr:putative cytochrome P450 oxidoreductase OrdA-like protein [Annulohypoxylon maeteangense]KAI0888728.1 putative cytochrome P450 oxidoreductase OrdA-like protein [Annulohypoxylon maeteangense]